MKMKNETMLQEPKATADTSKPLKPGCFYIVKKDIATSSLSGCNSLAETFAFCSSGTREKKIHNVPLTQSRLFMGERAAVRRQGVKNP